MVDRLKTVCMRRSSRLVEVIVPSPLPVMPYRSFSNCLEFRYSTAGFVSHISSRHSLHKKRCGSLDHQSHNMYTSGGKSLNHRCSCSSVNAQSKVIDGSAHAARIRKSVKEKILKRQLIDPNFVPGLAIVQIGSRPDSVLYVNMKKKMARECGMFCRHVHFPETITTKEVIEEVKRLNQDPSIHGMILQLPIPPHLASMEIIDAIDPKMDVDGFTSINLVRTRSMRLSILACIFQVKLDVAIHAAIYDAICRDV